MAGWWVWPVAAVLYLGFRLFYDNLRGKLTQPEIDTMLARAEAQGAGEVNDLSIVRTFLEEDDGREFVMVNLVRVPDDMVTDPDTDPDTEAQVPERRRRPWTPPLAMHMNTSCSALRKRSRFQSNPRASAPASAATPHVPQKPRHPAVAVR